MNVNPKLEKRMNRLIESGSFKDADDIIGRALDSFELEQEFLDKNHEALKDKLREGLKSELVELDRDVFDQLYELADSKETAAE